MENLVIGGALALAGVVVERLVDLIRGSRETAANRAARRWDVEYDALRDLGDMLPAFIGMQTGDLETRKVRAVTLAWRVRDPRASEAVELLVSLPVGSQEWNDQVGNAIRAVGGVMREL